MNYEEAKQRIDDRLNEIVREAEQPGTDEITRCVLDYEYDRLVYFKSELIKQQQRKEHEHAEI